MLDLEPSKDRPTRQQSRMAGRIAFAAWTLTMDFTALLYTRFGGFQGQYGVYLRS